MISSLTINDGILVRREWQKEKLVAVEESWRWRFFSLENFSLVSHTNFSQLDIDLNNDNRERELDVFKPITVLFSSVFTALFTYLIVILPLTQARSTTKTKVLTKSRRLIRNLHALVITLCSTNKAPQKVMC